MLDTPVSIVVTAMDGTCREATVEYTFNNTDNQKIIVAMMIITRILIVTTDMVICMHAYPNRSQMIK